MPSVRRVSEWYRQSFDEITRHDLPRTAEQEASFARLLATIYDRHSPTLVTMARGIMEFRQSHGLVDRKQRLPAVVEDDIFGFLDVFFMSRVGIRTLIAQHLALHEPRPNHVGIINTACRPSDVIHTAAMDAKAVCERSFGEAPDVKVLGDVKFQFAHIPMFIHHIIFELLKNSMRATVETHSEEHGRSKGLGVESAGAAGASPPSSSVVGEPRHGMPPVKIILSASEDTEDVVIKISDEGGGIPRSGIQRIFSYFYTTAPAAFMDGSHDAAADFSSDMPMAGLGFGLPLSRVYARYFGGDLQLISMERYGTDAFIYLRRLGDTAEPISECSILSGFAPDLAAAQQQQQHQFLQPPQLDQLHPTPGLPHASFRVSLRHSGIGEHNRSSGGKDAQ